MAKATRWMKIQVRFRFKRVKQWAVYPSIVSHADSGKVVMIRPNGRTYMRWWE